MHLFESGACWEDDGDACWEGMAKSGLISPVKLSVRGDRAGLAGGPLFKWNRDLQKGVGITSCKKNISFLIYINKALHTC